ncbi:MAG: DUF3828 domain-containing protein [Pseudomonadota bacterium]
MSARLPLLPALGMALGMALGLSLAIPAHGTDLAGTWRFTHALPAPWGAPLDGSASLGGKSLRLAAGRMQGPAPLDCASPARLEATAQPAEGLFQGSLPSPALPGAQGLGFSRFPVQGLRVSCDKGVFEFHQADADTLLLGLDNRVWVLSRAPGALAPADSPAGRVQALLEQHFSGPMGFDAATAQAKAPFLSKALNHLMAAYLARPRAQDEVPPINGDPYTDSQEYPTRFAVGTAQHHAGGARVTVMLADGWRRHGITYELVRENGSWQLDDLDYGQGGRLRHGLQQ